MTVKGITIFVSVIYNHLMNLVLTHEQADFDALAALFAAALLEDALPVLPRRMNRNVHAFITLYGLDFPFVDPRDLPQGAIESVTLVDTQSLITLKGFSRQTRVRVFDHHPARRIKHNPDDKKTPGIWEVTTFELGAATTYFVELLEERAEVLSSIQASLLLLGIYEDTGMLTYSRTTPRDMRAAGWLLEQGAELRILTDFLNPPLSQDQREVYDRLVANIQTLEIHGQKIMLACGETPNPTEEISTLAHKLRDLFDPDALFLLVQTPEGLRFVARSSTDQIDVLAVSNHFGGGGHKRAAAALVKKELGVVRAELLEILPQYVHPSVTVAQMMSKRPHLIAADAPVQEAARLMARYGYEGFPVLKEGQVIGLLTRRAVDKATNHRLNLTAESLMEAGVVYVQPGDSFHRLQTVMTDSGWGQVPVVDPESRKVVGIVTRTDVLKMLARRHPQTVQYHSLVARIQKYLPSDWLELIKAVADQAVNEHLPVYLVGGFARDLLLKRNSTDLDLVVEGDAIQLGKGLAAKYGGKLTTHARFGTSRWFLAGSRLFSPLRPAFLDLISARQEFYEHPSALPTVEHSSIKLDLHRRDFTINTLAVRLDGRHFGELHDYYGGLPDLERRLVRVLHSLSFVDDPTRMLRAVRYEQRYAFSIEPRTLQLMDEARPLLARLSPERIRHELDLILEEPKAGEMLSRLEGLGLIHSISEYLPWNAALAARLTDGLSKPIPDDWKLSPHDPGAAVVDALAYCLWLLDQPQAVIDHLNQRLSFPKSAYQAIRSASALRADLSSLGGAGPTQWVDRLDGAPLLAVYAVFLVTQEKALQTYALKWRKIHPYTTGHTLQARGLTPGPYFQNILHALRSAWLEGRLVTEAGEDTYLQELIENLSKNA